MSETRIYKVSGDKFVGGTRLVEAATSAQAIRHVTKSLFSVDIATTKDVANLVGAGIKIESAAVAEKIVEANP